MVSITVRNSGPAASHEVLIAGGQASLEVFLYDLIGSDTPECGPIDQIDVDPPAYSFHWTVAMIPANEAITCTARLRVVRVPTTYSTFVYAGADPHTQPPDPDESNNLASVALSFASPASPITIPAMSWWAFALMIAGVLGRGSQTTRR